MDCIDPFLLATAVRRDAPEELWDLLATQVAAALCRAPLGAADAEAVRALSAQLRPDGLHARVAARPGLPGVVGAVSLVAYQLELLSDRLGFRVVTARVLADVPEPVRSSLGVPPFAAAVFAPLAAAARVPLGEGDLVAAVSGACQVLDLLEVVVPALMRRSDAAATLESFALQRQILVEELPEALAALEVPGILAAV